MLKTTKLFISIIVVSAVIAAAAGAVFYDDSDGAHDYDGSVLIEDQYGVYFWVHGDGDNYGEVIKSVDGTRGLDIDYTDGSYGVMVNGINGLSQTSDYSGYWALYQYEDGKWVYSIVGLSSVSTDDCDYVGLFYVNCDTSTYAVTAGGPDNVEVPEVWKAAYFTGSHNDVVFTIQSQSGMYLYANGHGDNVFDAFVDATETYNIPFVASHASYGDGISSLFGMSTSSTASGWIYWAQFTSNNNGPWAYANQTMEKLSTSVFTQVGISYGDGSEITAPLYSQSSENASSLILIEDQYGVYTWLSADSSEYSTYADMLVGLNGKNGLSIDYSDSGTYFSINSINGLACDYSKASENIYYYWSTYVYENGTWTYSDKAVDGLSTSMHSVIGLFYIKGTMTGAEEGGPDNLTVPSVADAAAWNGSTDGTVFAVQSESGYYFYINGTGSTVFDAFSNAAETYNIPFVASHSSYGDGISSLFGLSMSSKTDGDKTVWTYWAQMVLNDGGTGWTYSNSTMDKISSSGCAQMAVIYGDGGMGEGGTATVPVYSA